MYDRCHRRLYSAVLGYVNIMRKQKLTLWSYHYFVGLDRLLLYSKGQVDLVWENIGKGLCNLIEILYFYIVHSVNPEVSQRQEDMEQVINTQNIHIYSGKCCD